MLVPTLHFNPNTYTHPDYVLVQPAKERRRQEPVQYAYSVHGQHQIDQQPFVSSRCHGLIINQTHMDLPKRGLKKNKKILSLFRENKVYMQSKTQFL